MKRLLVLNKLDFIDQLDQNYDGSDLPSISGGLTYPITINDKPVILEFIIRRLEWTRLQTLVLLKSNSTSIVFYVDSSIDELHIDISSTAIFFCADEITNINQIELLTPNNSAYSLTTNVMNTQHLYMWKILQPYVGAWRLTTSKLSQSINLNVQIQGKSSVACSSSLQKDMEGNVDSSGYTELTTEPLIDSDLLILTTCENVNFTYANISLINQSGQIIENYSPLKIDQLEIVTKIRVPQQAFRIQTMLELSDGTRIQRIEKQLISPTMFTIELINQPYILSIGETIQMNYTIKSLLSEKVYIRLQIRDTLNLIDSNGMEKNLTFINETFQMDLFTLPQ
ncbi:unnamed protein product, partial [Rotaria sp. Silwood2]